MVKTRITTLGEMKVHLDLLISDAESSVPHLRGRPAHENRAHLNTCRCLRDLIIQ